jgi:ATP adenylyltransferase
MSYVTSDKPKSTGCVFCDAVTAGDDAAMLILHRGAHSYVIMNRYPYNNGHIMVVPYAHVPRLTDLTTEVAAEIVQLTSRTQDIIQQKMNPHGFNLGMNQGSAAGAGIEEHLHMHLVPRWVGDTNFMPAIGETRVIPQDLHDTYAL